MGISTGVLSVHGGLGIAGITLDSHKGVPMLQISLRHKIENLILCSNYVKSG